ncbi:MAG TPA: hypothetical protein VFW15_06535 [Thermoanaerobaculia bacterium]|nr:hypothetical protein [Thermoanaerobaculia bacterium]
MESILTDYLVLESGAFLGALALLVVVFGGVLLGCLADEERTGKWFSWAEWPHPESEAPARGEVQRAA